MRIEEIESVLRTLTAPEPPESLQRRCLTTVPVEAVRGHAPARRGRLPLRRLAAAIVVAAALMLIVWFARPAPLSGLAAYAAAREAMQHVPFFHVKGKQQGIYPDGGRTGSQWYTGSWIEEEIWFDARRGNLRELHGPTEVPAKSLELPNGSVYNRVGDFLAITHFSPRRWEKRRSQYSTYPMRLKQTAGGFADAPPPGPVSTSGGTWKGREATVLTFEAAPSPARALRGAPTVRTLLFLDPQTHLGLAWQQFATQPSGAESLVLEWEFDYTEEPSQAIFSPRRLEQGATKIFHGRGEGRELWPPVQKYARRGKK